MEQNVRCSSCEPLLDRYVEGTLTPREMIAVAEHLSACANCSRLLAELKIVDALLVTTQTPQLPPNFTFAVMAEARSMPVPKAREHRVWSFIALYVAAAWVAAIAGMLLSGVRVASIASTMASAFQHFAQAIAGGFASVAHGAPELTAFSLAVLLVDFAVAAAVAALYLLIRPRLAAQLASRSETP